MDKTVKILYLTTNQILVTELVEVAAIDIGAPDCKLVEPYLVGEQDTLSPWLVDVTNQNTFMLSSDKILTLVEPQPTLLEKYEKLIK